MTVPPRPLLTLALFFASVALHANTVGGVLRTGPTLSETQPHWRLAVIFDYALPKAAFGLGVDMNISRHIIEREGAEELRLSIIGFVGECRLFVHQDDYWILSAGGTVGARSMVYETPSNNSAFVPIDDWIPNTAPSPLGSTWYTSINPFLQADYLLGGRYSLLARVGYDLNIGPDYVDVTAASLSGVTIQLGVRLPLLGE